MSIDKLSSEEAAVLDLLAEAWNAFTRLGQEHPDQSAEFRHGIHALQCQIMARPTRRLMNREMVKLCHMDWDSGNMVVSPGCRVCKGSGIHNGRPCDGIPF